MSQINHEGWIEVIYGPMFSGKSSQLLRKVRRFQHAKKKCLVINYQKDDRYSTEDVMATHDRQTKQAIKTNSLSSIQNKSSCYDVVAIDQGQFFIQIVQFCQWLANRGIIVIVAALDGTFQRKPFGNIINLLPVAQKITKLTAVCVYCTKQASFTQRVIESQDIELIGGQQLYKPVCRKCYWSTSNKYNKQQTNIKQENEIIMDFQEKKL